MEGKNVEREGKEEVGKLEVALVVLGGGTDCYEIRVGGFLPFQSPWPHTDKVARMCVSLE